MDFEIKVKVQTIPLQLHCRNQWRHCIYLRSENVWDPVPNFQPVFNQDTHFDIDENHKNINRYIIVPISKFNEPRVGGFHKNAPFDKKVDKQNLQNYRLVLLTSVFL